VYYHSLFLLCCHRLFIFSVLSLSITNRFDNSFSFKGSSSTSIRYFILSISAQPQLLKIESPGDVDIVGRTPLYLTFLFDLSFFLSHYITYV
jgi:hypothetical protein